MIVVTAFGADKDLYRETTGFAFQQLWNGLLDFLPSAQCVSLVSQILANMIQQVEKDFILQLSPADKYWRPKEPEIVVLEMWVCPRHKRPLSKLIPLTAVKPR